MELYPSCVPCVVNNLLHIAEGVLPNARDRIILLRRVMEASLSEMYPESSAPILTGIGYDILREMSGVDDPYAGVKREFNDLMLGLEARFQTLVDRAEDPLHAALVAAGSANLIDFGAFREIAGDRVLAMMSEHLEQTFLPEDSYRVFERLLEERKKLLILCDNCGEIVLDKVLVRELKRRFSGIDVTCVVRGGPILNDATIEDANYVGLDRLCPVISTGGRIPGFLPEAGTLEFREQYRESPAILAKGMGNFECAPFGEERMFFLFVVKCETLSKNLRLSRNTLVFRQGRGSLF